MNQFEQTIHAAIIATRAGVGFARASRLAAAEVTGEDRLTFLDAQLPLDLTPLKPGQGGTTALLERRGRILTDLRVLVCEDRLLILAPADRLEFLVATLEGQRFRERASLRSLADEVEVWELHGPASPAVLGTVLGVGAPVEPWHHVRVTVAERTLVALTDPWTGDPGFRLVVPRAASASASERILIAGASEGLTPLSAEALEVLRIEGGDLRHGVDMDERTILLELDRPEMVTHNTGCYPGQETIARVHARGQVQRVIRGLLIDGAAVPVPGTLLQMGDDPVGETLSATRSPSLDSVIALARVRRSAAEPDSVLRLKVGEDLVPARVRELPLYAPPGPRELAESLYREGISAFANDRWEDALARFERAVFMNPAHMAAYESAGVCLERLGRRDEAEATMRGLTEMDPENVMAWTNLSRYAAEAGNIEEAERLKGHVTFLVWKKEAGEKSAARRMQAEVEARKAALVDRVPLFEQVLEMDPDDVVARFGLGKILLDLERFAEAVPHFERAVEKQKDYSMAFNHLATCLLKLERWGEARDVLVRGVEAATRKGDWIPRKDMERKLLELDS